MKKIIILLVLFVMTIATSNAQTFYSEISEKQYNKIVSGDLFYPGQVQLTDGNWYKGWIARFPDSNRIRFRPIEDSVQVFLLTNQYVKSFTYNINDSIPQFIFREIPISKRRSKVEAIELLIHGELNLYIHKSVEEVTYTNALLKMKSEFQMLMDFYVEKDGILYYMEDFERNLSYLIRDKEEVFNHYRETKKQRKGDIYNPYIDIIIEYNEAEYAE